MCVLGGGKGQALAWGRHAHCVALTGNASSPQGRKGGGEAGPNAEGTGAAADPLNLHTAEIEASCSAVVPLHRSRKPSQGNRAGQSSAQQAPAKRHLCKQRDSPPEASTCTHLRPHTSKPRKSPLQTPIQVPTRTCTAPTHLETGKLKRSSPGAPPPTAGCSWRQAVPRSNATAPCSKREGAGSRKELQFKSVRCIRIRIAC